jgi:hypothetical protein
MLAKLSFFNKKIMLRKIFFFCALFVLSAGAILAQSVDTVFIKKTLPFSLNVSRASACDLKFAC